MIRRSLAILTFVWACAASAEAQIAASLRINKKQHVAGEPVLAVVTVTNHAGRELTFHSDGRFQWLDFIVRTGNGEPVSPRGNAVFGAMKLAPGQTMAREVDLSQHFQLSRPGNFSAVAVVHPPGERGAANTGTTTNRVTFHQNSGRVYWSQRVGLPAGNRTREFRILNFTGDTKAQLYAQIIDPLNGQMIRTFLLGDVLMLRKPLTTVDRQQRMHVMFLATPTMWVHCVIDINGQLVERQIHQRGPQGEPQLLTFEDGSVRVGNSIPYDPKAAAEQRAKLRKASDRPPGTY